MLNILFVPGSFGTTIQVLVYRFSSHYLKSDITHIDPCDVLGADGSMHKHPSTGHILDRMIIEKFFSGEFDQNTSMSNLLSYAELSSFPVYDYAWFLEGVKNFRKNDQTIFVSILTIEQAELCLLYHYNKKDTARLQGIDNSGFQLDDIFELWGIRVSDFSRQSYLDLLNIFSDSYPQIVGKWIDSINHTDHNWLQINILDFLVSTKDIFSQIIDFTGGIYDPDQKLILETFADEWRQKQQYVLDQYDLINNIVDGIISNKLDYRPNMNFMAEAIILRKLKSHGYKINESRRT